MPVRDIYRSDSWGLSGTAGTAERRRALVAAIGAGAAMALAAVVVAFHCRADQWVSPTAGISSPPGSAVLRGGSAPLTVADGRGQQAAPPPVAAPAKPVPPPPVAAPADPVPVPPQISAALALARGEEARARNDYAEAVRRDREAAELGAPEAQFNLGVAYDKGEGVAPDHAEALRWYHPGRRPGRSGGAEHWSEPRMPTGRM